MNTMKKPYEIVFGQPLIVPDVTIKGIVVKNEDDQDEKGERSEGNYKVGALGANDQGCGQGDDG